MKLVSSLRYVLALGALAALLAPSAAHAGGVCATDVDCGNPNSGRVCDPVSLMCIDGCRGTNGNGCAMNAPCTSTNDEIGVCSTVCALPADCMDPNLPLCDMVKLACVECLVDGECTAPETCDPDTGLCAAGGGTGGAGGGGVGGAGGAGVGGAGGGVGGMGGAATTGATTGATMTTTATTGAGATAAAGTGGSADVTGLAAEGGGCDCSAVGDPSAPGTGRHGGLALAAIAAAVALGRRRLVGPLLRRRRGAA